MVTLRTGSRAVAVVSAATISAPELTDTEAEFMVPLIDEARSSVGLAQADMGFTCSGSSDFIAIDMSGTDSGSQRLGKSRFPGTGQASYQDNTIFI